MNTGVIVRHVRETAEARVDHAISGIVADIERAVGSALDRLGMPNNLKAPDVVRELVAAAVRCNVADRAVHREELIALLEPSVLRRIAQHAVEALASAKGGGNAAP